MKNLMLSGAFLALSFSAFSQDFSPIHAQTSNFKMKTSREFRKQVGRGGYTTCHVTTALDEEKNVVTFKMGITGSNFDHFGWDMNVPVSDLPLLPGYSRRIWLGGSPMVLSYDGTTLSYEFTDAELYSRIYPFELVIDANLQNVKSFKGQFAGWEMSFNRPKKHVQQECKF